MSINKNFIFGDLKNDIEYFWSKYQRCNAKKKQVILLWFIYLYFVTVYYISHLHSII